MASRSRPPAATPRDAASREEASREVLPNRRGEVAPLLGAATGVAVTLAWPLAADGLIPSPWAEALAIGAGGALLLGALFDLRGNRRTMRTFTVLGAGLAAVLTLVQRPQAPGPGLVVMLAAGMLVVSASDLLREEWATVSGRRRMPGAAGGALIGCAALLAVHPVGVPRGLALASMALVLLASATRDWRKDVGEVLPVGITGGLAAVAAIAVGTGHEGLTMALAALMGPAALLAAAVQSPTSTVPAMLSFVVASPARTMVLGFLAICAVGSALLALPFAAEGPAVSLIDAAFTAVSATCVTGLIVVDTPEVYSAAGELIVLLLIQVGGLGIMTFASAASALLGQRMSLNQERTAANLIGPEARRDLRGALRNVLLVTFGTETIGALLLLPAFLLRGDGFVQALWRAVFTAISAFCNAGFALQTDSLLPYADSPWVLTVVSLCIVLGGLGPAVVLALPRLARGHGSLHGKLVVVTTLALLVVPTVLYALLEWRASLAGLGPVDRLFNAWFQSVTLRTAGFNSVDLTQVNPATWTIMVLCMFVGGSPGSTAGGAKTTTMAVLALAVVAAVRGRSEAFAFGRRLPHRTVYEAAAIASAGMSAVIGGLVALQLTQAIPLHLALFEVVSALGTVGLSVGATPMLDSVGKIIIMGCMFAGRVGPLTLFVFLAEQQGDHPAPRPPIEYVPVG